jgi:LysM repeat protein
MNKKGSFIRRIRLFTVSLVASVLVLGVMLPHAAFAATEVTMTEASYQLASHAGQYRYYPKRVIHRPAPKKAVVKVIPKKIVVKPAPKKVVVCKAIYVVKKGDSLSAIARHFRTTVHTLASVNNIRNPSLIFVGQRLCIR